MNIPSKYAHVARPDAPSMIREAWRLYGTQEKPGGANNPEIMKWARELEAAIGRNLGYDADSIPWCGLFVGVVTARAGKAEQIPKTPLWARSWAEFGLKSPGAGLGDVLVFSRDGGGHVGLYVGEGMHDRLGAVYHVLGGNQGDAVSIAQIEKRRCIAVRRPRWHVKQPASVASIWIGEGHGHVSNNEA